MNSSIIIARLLGPLMLATAAAILLNRKGIQKASESTARSPGLIFHEGAATLLGGLAIVEFHNVWNASWQTIITVVGWLMVINGGARMLAPDRMAEMGKSMAGREVGLVTSAAISAVLGIILTIQGFTS